MKRKLFNRSLAAGMGYLLWVAGVADVGAQPVPGGTLDPLTIPKYVTPLVIPPAKSTQNDLARLAKMLEPSVVNITVESTPRPQTTSRRRAPQSEEGEEGDEMDLFRRFFGSPFGDVPQGRRPPVPRQGTGSGVLVDKNGRREAFTRTTTCYSAINCTLWVSIYCCVSLFDHNAWREKGRDQKSHQSYAGAGAVRRLFAESWH